MGPESSRWLNLRGAFETAGVLSLATLTASGIDIAMSLGLGAGSVSPVPVTYYMLTVCLGLAGSALLGLILGGLGAGIGVSLAAWALANAWSGGDLAGAAVFAGGVWLVLLLSRRWQGAATITGARMGAAAGAALAVWPLAVKRLAVAFGADVIVVAFTPVLIAAVIYVVFTLVGGRGRAGLRRFGETALALGLVLFAFTTGYERNRLSPNELPFYVDRVMRVDGPHIILIVLDTVRADRMSLYGYSRPTTPRLKEFVARHDNAVVYPLAFATSSWTLPSHASLFTGLLPSEHGVYMIGMPRRLGRTGALQANRTLAEILRAAGYRNGAVVANSLLASKQDLYRGFDWAYKPPLAKRLVLVGETLRANLFRPAFAWFFPPYSKGDAVNAGVLAFLDACGAGPCFVFANYMEAHTPYTPRPPHAGIFEIEGEPRLTTDAPAIFDDEDTLRTFSNRYDEEIHSVDARVGELFDVLGNRGMLDASWVVITSDHGDSFGEHGVTMHGSSLYNEQVRIPLVIKPPRGQRIPPVDVPVSLIDIPATLAEAVMGATPDGGDSLLGRSPVRGIAQMQFFGAREFVVKYRGASPDPMRAVADGELKLIDDGMTQALYDLSRDLGEQRNLIDSASPTERRRLLALMPEIRVNSTDADEQADDEARLAEEQELLRALGYLE